MHFSSLVALAVSCAIATTASAMTVTFGTRQAGGRPLHPNGNTDWCIVPDADQGTTPSHDVHAAIYPCAESDFTLWNFIEGETEIQSVGAPDLCLKSLHTLWGHGDPQPFGSYNGAGLRVGWCGEVVGLTPVTRWVVEGNRFRVADSTSNQCLDLPDGIPARRKVLQTWECTEGNSNQVWTF
ncbi:hypothetical protein PM082_022199 [Marasmius tenuissimus]|nr:hypothetical protein PM082_022199 [Marasmius tenuissimus]